MVGRIRPNAATGPWELRQMLKDLKKTLGRESENREGLTLIETTVIVGAMAIFATIYAYIVTGALM